MRNGVSFKKLFDVLAQMAENVSGAQDETRTRTGYSPEGF